MRKEMSNGDELLQLGAEKHESNEQTERWTIARLSVVSGASTIFNPRLSKSLRATVWKVPTDISGFELAVSCVPWLSFASTQLAKFDGGFRVLMKYK